jgi:hypothetical protein
VQQTAQKMLGFLRTTRKMKLMMLEGRELRFQKQLQVPLASDTTVKRDHYALK